jgi:hypothetical protein
MMLLIPATIWSGAIEAMRRNPHDRERVAYFDGVRCDDFAVATTLTLPEVEEDALHFFVTAENMSRAGRHLSVHNLRRFAQVHCHPEDWTGHSAYDDEMAYSQRPGSISIVVPHFAGCTPGLGDCGVHRRGKREWRELTRDEVHGEVAIVPSIVDLRS